jgi:hypothetical protein
MANSPSAKRLRSKGILAPDEYCLKSKQDCTEVIEALLEVSTHNAVINSQMPTQEPPMQQPLKERMRSNICIGSAAFSLLHHNHTFQLFCTTPH